MLTLVDECFFTDDFAQTASLYIVSGSGSASTINVIFDQMVVESDIGEMNYANARPVALCRSVDVSGSSTRSVITIGGTLYYVTAVQPEATGTTLLVLSTERIHGK